MQKEAEEFALKALNGLEAREAFEQSCIAFIKGKLAAPPSEADGPQVEFVHLPKSDWPEHIRKAFKEANGSEICNADPLNKQESHDE